MTFYHLNPGRKGERLARRLERTQDYRVLRLLPHLTEIWCRSMPVPSDTFTIAVLDSETTGLDPTRHKLIEVAVATLTICLDEGDVVDVAAPISWLEDPGEPITPEIERLTGITDADLVGQAFDEEAITATLADVDLIVAHNARFDLAFFRARFPEIKRPWACSAQEVDWPEHGLEGGRSVAALLTAAGHFLTDAHRAGPDAWALACLLAMPSGDGRAIAAHLVDEARLPTARLYAERAPFELKDTLKAAGYRWSPERRAWWTEGEPERIANEAVWLQSLHPAVLPCSEPVDWFNRHLT